MARRPKNRPTPAPAPGSVHGSVPDVRLPPEDKILCAGCGESTLETEAQPFLDPADGLAKLRCARCAAAVAVPPGPVRNPPDDPLVSAGLARELAHELAQVQEERDALLKHVEQADAARARAEASTKRLVDRITGAVGLGRPEGARGATVGDALEVLDRIFAETLALRDAGRQGGEAPTAAALAEAASQVEDLSARFAREREAHTQTRSALLLALSRERDLEHWLGLASPAEEGRGEGIAAWMLDLATRAATSAPTELDEPALVGLLADVLLAGFAERTLAAQRTLLGTRGAPAGEELLRVEQVARGVAITIREMPDESPEDKKEAIDLAWMALNTAANEARAAVLVERERLTALEAAARFAERPVVGARRFLVRKPSSEPIAEALAEAHGHGDNLPPGGAAEIDRIEAEAAERREGTT